MTPNEMASMLASMQGRCQNGKCPFSAKCKGPNGECEFKEIAFLIRALMAEVVKVRAANTALVKCYDALNDYIKELEDVNERYYRAIRAFQDGVRPSKKMKRSRLYKRKPPKNPLLADGDERYAYVEPKQDEKLPLVIL